MLSNVVIIIISVALIILSMYLIFEKHLIFKYKIRYRKTIKNAKRIIENCNKKTNGLCNKKIIVCYPFFNRRNKYANASAFLFPFIILKNDWTFLCEDNEESISYLFLTIGHEIAHKDKEPGHISKNKKDRYFTQHVREIRADFYGVDFAVLCGFDRKTVINSKVKIEEKFNDAEAFNKYSDHPTAQLRYECLKEFSSFKPETIKYIAKEEHYTNQKVIEYLCAHSFYKDFFN